MDTKDFLIHARRFAFLIRPKGIYSKLRPSEAFVFMNIIDLHKKKIEILPSVLSSYCDLSRSAIAQILNQLQKKELIKRFVDPTDRRRILIVPVKKNMAFCFHEDLEMIEALRAHLNDEDFVHLAHLLEKSNGFLKSLESKEESL